MYTCMYCMYVCSNHVHTSLQHPPHPFIYPYPVHPQYISSSPRIYHRPSPRIPYKTRVYTCIFNSLILSIHVRYVCIYGYSLCVVHTEQAVGISVTPTHLHTTWGLQPPSSKPYFSLFIPKVITSSPILIGKISAFGNW